MTSANAEHELRAACSRGDVDAAALCLDRGAAVNRNDGGDEFPLVIACQNGHADVVRLLLRRGADVNGGSPLFAACKNGHVDAARLCIDHGAEVNRISKRTRISPLYAACSNGHVDVARLCLDRGADVDRGNSRAMTPFSIACSSGQIDMARLCLDRGAVVDRANRNGRTPLSGACRYGHLATATLCLDRGADVGRADKWGETPLSLARREGHADVVQLLLQRGATPAPSVSAPPAPAPATAPPPPAPTTDAARPPDNDAADEQRFQRDVRAAVAASLADGEVKTDDRVASPPPPRRPPTDADADAAALDLAARLALDDASKLAADEDAFEADVHQPQLEDALSAHRAELGRLRGILSRRRIPDALVCPLTLEIMERPVVCADGHTYEDEAIKAWFATGKQTSPKTGLVLPHLHLVPNHGARSMISDFLDEARSVQEALGDGSKA